MASNTLEVRPSQRPGYVLSLKGEELKIPIGWALLKPGDAALSRRIKKDGPSWTVKEPKGRKLFSKGIWAPAKRIEHLRSQLTQERATPSYQKKLQTSRQRRDDLQQQYAVEFHQAIQRFLNFSYQYDHLEEKLASYVTQHAIPIGSGTVARTTRIPIEQRAESSVIAWMRHETTAYDHMQIPRKKGSRREIRRMLAKRSREILDQYRTSDPIDFHTCPLYQRLSEQKAD